MINSGSAQVDECEANASDLCPLLEFEGEVGAGNGMEGDIFLYKNCGDALFRLNDYTTAISYYEAALDSVSSAYEVGSVLVVRRSGHCVIAEVDCLENDTYDVSYLSGNGEASIPRKAIIMALWTKVASFLQAKILLNLSRCLLKLADFVSSRESSVENACHKDKFRQSAVLACSSAITICEYHSIESTSNSRSELDSLIEKARIVRSRAFLGLKKYPNAIADAKKVNATANREAQCILNEIKTAQAYTKSVDKKLSKEVCRWVQSATESYL
jgi:tetratricopeptide (TPR) repeat protein